MRRCSPSGAGPDGYRPNSSPATGAATKLPQEAVSYRCRSDAAAARWTGGLSDMADVFVSYARKDKARVAAVVAALEAQGWSVWWDPAIDPGQQFDQLISDELARARAVLVVWTPASVESRWVRGEARDAADRGILVPVQIESARLPIDFRAFHTTDLDHADEMAGSAPFQDVVRAIEVLVGRPGRMAAATTGHESLEPGAHSGPPRIAICVLPLANLSG